MLSAPQQKRHLQISKGGRTAVLGGWGSWERYANESTGSDKEVFVFIKESHCQVAISGLLDMVCGIKK